MKEKNVEYTEIILSLIMKVREGNQAAFEELLKLYDPLVSSFVERYYSSCLSREDAEDLRQELSVVFYNSILSYDVEQTQVSFGLYAKICMNNAFVTQLRTLKKRNEKNVVVLDVDDAVTNAVSEEKNPEQELVEREKMNELNTRIKETLSEFENTVWKMYFAGCSSKEMAEKMQTNERSVNNAVYRIRKKLKGLFDNVK